MPRSKSGRRRRVPAKDTFSREDIGQPVDTSTAASAPKRHSVAASPDGTVVPNGHAAQSGPAVPNGDVSLSVKGKAESGPNGSLTPPSMADSICSKRAVISQWTDLAESAGDVAEKEADSIGGAGPLPVAPSSQFNDDGSAVADGSLVAVAAGEPKHADDTDYPPLTDNAGRKAAARERERANAYRAGGIRFAPWNIPYRRRLQTLAVLMHSLSIATLVSFFFFLCAIPLTWPILMPYLLHMLLSKSATDGSLKARSERFRRLPVWKFFADYFPAELHKTHDLVPTRKYIFGYHPHGIISHGAFAAFGTEALGFSDKFPGITNSLLTLDSNFRIPLYRDYILSLGLQSVSKESISNILSRGGINGEGMGRAVTIVVGGARESLEAQPGVLNLVLGERKGFIKMAIRTGADLVPVLAFGENDLYDQVSPKQHPLLHSLQMKVLRTLKFTLPFLHGRGIFNYDVGLMPYRRPMNIVVGRPIRVAQAREAEIDSREVDRLHREYVSELTRMWDAYKDVFAVGRKGEMQILK